MRCLLLTVSIGVAVLLGCSTDSQPTSDEDAGAEANRVAPSQDSRPTLADVAAEASDLSSGEVELSKITLAAPEGWERKPPSSGFLLAEFLVPRAEGDDADGRLTVSVAGGSIEANVDRWRSQFGDKPEKEEQREIETAGLKITLVDFSGEFNDQRGPFAPATKHSGYRMLAAIIPVDGELHFIKCTGPMATLAEHAEEIEAFVKSVQRK